MDEEEHEPDLEIEILRNGKAVIRQENINYLKTYYEHFFYMKESKIPFDREWVLHENVTDLSELNILLYDLGRRREGRGDFREVPWKKIGIKD